MRHFRTRRRYRFTLLALLTLCAILLTESRIEALMPELKAVAEARVERALGGGSELAIGNIDGGILQPLVLNGVRIEQSRGQAIFRSAVIDNIRTNYRIWDLLRMKGKPQASDILEKDSSVYINFSLRKGGIKGFAGIEGTPEESKASGYIALPKDGKVEFTWAVKGDNFDLALYPGKGTARIIGSVSDDGLVEASFRIDNVKLRGFDIKCAGRIKNRISGADGRGGAVLIGGEVEASGLAVNGRPLPDIRASYRSSGGVLTIDEMKIESGLVVRGSVSFNKPDAADLTLTANNVSLNRIFLIMGFKEAAAVLTGTLNGKFTLKGREGKFRLESVFDIRQGTMGNIGFNHMSASLSGELPYLNIEDAGIYRDSGYLEVAGELDLNKAGRDTFFKGVKLITDDNAIAWDEWGLVDRNGMKEMSMSKSLTCDLGVRFKKIVNDRKVDESSRGGDSVKLEYKLTHNESLGVTLDKDRSLMGFEHRDKF